jgi:hypothetical protein
MNRQENYVNVGRREVKKRKREKGRYPQETNQERKNSTQRYQCSLVSPARPSRLDAVLVDDTDNDVLRRK